MDQEVYELLLPEQALDAPDTASDRASSSTSWRPRYFAYCVVLLALTACVADHIRNILLERVRTAACSSEVWSSGQWTPAPNLAGDWEAESEKGDLSVNVMELSGFQGCASSRERAWHLGTNLEERVVSRYRARASGYRWQPPAQCQSHFDSEELVLALVERGSWYLVGGMSTREHRCASKVG